MDVKRIFNDAGQVFAAESLGFVLVDRGNLEAGRQFTVVFMTTLRPRGLSRRQQRPSARPHLIAYIYTTIIIINNITNIIISIIPIQQSNRSIYEE